MLHPATREEFEALASQGNLIPVVREILADLDTPLSLFRRLDDGQHSFLFESVEGGEKWARYSFLGFGARATFRATGSKVTWSDASETTEQDLQGDPLEFLRERLQGVTPVALPGVELPRFVGGAVGMVGWDWVRFVENIPDDNPDELGLPDLAFIFPEMVVVYDNVRHKASVVRQVELADGEDIAARYDEAVKAIDELVVRLRGPLEAEPVGEDHGDEDPEDLPVQYFTTREHYHAMVEQSKEYIRAGDIFQVVPSQRFCVAQEGLDPFTLYRSLRTVNPSPYLFFLRTSGAVLIGSSPEILVRLEDQQVDVRPIAGTRRRGKTEEEDLALEEELLADPKERSEHLMLVDLGRNDVGRVAEVGSVEVNEYALIERYSHVMHIVSNVRGQLRKGLDWLDVLRATFPAGTLSGAPKVRAMEIIDELETLRRGYYGGCIGYIDYSGNMDMAIAIRTMLVKDGGIYLQAGGGVVADSDPEFEYQESLSKARGLMRAISKARRGLDI